MLEVTGLNADQHRQIVLMIESLQSEEPIRLKPVYDAFDGEFEYGVLRCVAAGM